MDRTLMRMDVNLGESTIGIKDELDTNFEGFKFNLELGKQTERNHVILYAGDSFSNKGGVIFTFKGRDKDGLLVFNTYFSNGNYPFLNKDIYVRPGNVAIYLGASEVTTIGSKAIYNIDKSIEEYVKSRFKEFPEIEYGSFIYKYENFKNDIGILHDGVEEKYGNNLEIYNASILIVYSVYNNSISIHTINCINEDKTPYLYKRLYELWYNVSNIK